LDLLFIGIPYRLVNGVSRPFNSQIDNIKGLKAHSSGALSANFAIETGQNRHDAPAYRQERLEKRVEELKVHSGLTGEELRPGHGGSAWGI
jgi:hypothetical protein